MRIGGTDFGRRKVEARRLRWQRGTNVVPERVENWTMVPFHIVISGPPGGGKTALAQQLATKLKTACLSKDLLKESLYEAMPTQSEAESLRLSALAMSVLYGVARVSGAGAVLEANWKPEADGAQLRKLGRPLVQIFCSAPGDILRQRLQHRVRAGTRHPVHRDVISAAVLDEMVGIAASEAHVPLPLNAPLLSLDTSIPLDITSITAWIDEQQAG